MHFSWSALWTDVKVFTCFFFILFYFYSMFLIHPLFQLLVVCIRTDSFRMYYYYHFCVVFFVAYVTVFCTEWKLLRWKGAELWVVCVSWQANVLYSAEQSRRSNACIEFISWKLLILIRFYYDLKIQSTVDDTQYNAHAHSLFSFVLNSTAILLHFQN